MPQIPFAFQWTISETQLLPLKDSVKKCLFSTSITNIPEFEYFLQIYPNGHNDKYRGRTWISLYLKFKDVKKVEADYTFSIASANYSFTDSDIYEKSYAWGPLVCKTEEFFYPEKKFIVDGKCTVKVDGIFKYEKEDAIPVQKWSGGEMGDEIWNKDDIKDFTIITADGKEIKVHKFILGCRSDVFSAMLNSNMKESIENRITIPDFSFNIVEAALKLIYECNFTSALSMDELMQLLQFFDKYQLLFLKAKVEPYLISQISAATVIRLTNSSILTNSFKLKEKCIVFLSVAFASKTPLANFNDLDKDILFKIVGDSLYRIVETGK